MVTHDRRNIPIAENSRRLVGFDMFDDDGVTPFDGTRLDFARLWLYDQDGNEINNRDGTDVLGVDIVVTDKGKGTIALTPLDNIMVGTLKHETHRVEVATQWDGNAALLDRFAVLLRVEQFKGI